MHKYVTLYSRIICCYSIEIMNNNVSIRKVCDINNFKIWEGQIKNMFYGETYNNDLQWKPISYIANDIGEKIFICWRCYVIF